jgi:hypothetical protein
MSDCGTAEAVALIKAVELRSMSIHDAVKLRHE